MVPQFHKKKGGFAEQAVITAPEVESFREYVLFIQNGIRLLDVKGNLVQTAAEDSGEPADPEDTGEKGYNYCSGSFAWDVESGMWGIFRVVKRTFGYKCKGMCRKIRDCFR